MEAPAAFARATNDKDIRCGLCPHNCLIRPGEDGYCLTRHNHDGRLIASTYGRLKAGANDPIEKKPLFHFYPGSLTFSIAQAGCNLACPFCQNYHLSQQLREGASASQGQITTPQDVMEAARQSQAASISFTYSEPILQFEFARDVAAVAKPQGIDIVFVTNGQANKEPAKQIADFVSAANVDLKCFDKKLYKETLDGHLQSTLNTIEILFKAGVWIEITTLVIPGFNDDDSQLRAIADFIVGIDPSIPWHVSRFYPTYRWTHVPPTPTETISRARQIGLAQGLQYVYTGNVPGDSGEKTLCPKCQNVVVDRTGYRIMRIDTNNGRCTTCGETIAAVGLK